MKQSYFMVTYKNGHSERFYCYGFVEAIILAMNHARNMGWNMALDSVSNESGATAINIKFPEFEIAK
jgi:hypothetical protein